MPLNILFREAESLSCVSQLNQTLSHFINYRTCQGEPGTSSSYGIKINNMETTLLVPT